MIMRTAIVSFLLTAAYGLLAQATDDFALPNGRDCASANDPCSHLVPKQDELSGGSRNLIGEKQSKDAEQARTGKPDRQSGEASGREAAETPGLESGSRRPLGLAVLSIGGLIGAVGAAAVGRWRQARPRRQARTSLPAALVAGMNESRPQTVQTPNTAARRPSQSRRAA